MDAQTPPLFEAPLAHETIQLMGERAWEAPVSGGFVPVAVERPGGGRIKNKQDPAPADITYVQGIGRNIPLHRLAADAWRALVGEARAAHIQAPLLLPVSGYRSWAEQNVLWQRALGRYKSPEEARKYVAPPGGSAHQSGRAIDFHLGGSIDSSTSKRNITYLRTLPSYLWLVANAQRFGFYPYAVEPWHWEYNPPASGVGPQPRPQPQPPSTQRPTLRQGSRGPAVQEAQSRLNVWLASRPSYHGRPLVVDGVLGLRTHAAVRAFQQSAGLKVDGVIGPPTWARLLQLRPAPTPRPQPMPRPQPAPSSNALPQLIQRENQPPDSTLYVDIRLGSEGRARPMTGIFIPEHYLPQPQVDILLYLHGWKAQRKQPDPGWSVNWYWHDVPLRAFREELNNSHKNVILVSPTLGKNSDAGWLMARGGLDRYLDAVMAALRAYGPYRGQSAPVGNIILASHSGGGVPMRALALPSSRYASLIRECWGFDCMYNGDDAAAWGSWATRNPTARLYNYYRLATATAPQSEALQRRALPNVSIFPLQKQQISHDRVPIAHWVTRLEAAAFLSER
jgi:hypothetical protein